MSKVRNSKFDAKTNTWLVNGVMKLTNIHPVSNCEGRPCIVHNPTPNYVPNIEDWPYLFRANRQWERVCACGIGHYDLDDVWFYENILGLKGSGVHGCCGHCSGVPADERGYPSELEEE